MKPMVQKKVDRIIAGLYFQEIYPYASGKRHDDGEELLNIYLDMQKPESQRIITCIPV